MKRVLLASLVAFWVCAPLPGLSARAGVISRDWKTPGDGLLTYDDVNQREWLDLSQTLLSSQFPGADREAKFQYVLGQTGSGGLFEGFSLAESGDVVALAESAGVDTSTQSYATNVTPTLALGELIGFTILPPNGNKLALGLVDGVGPSPPIQMTAILRTSFESQAGLTFATPHTQFLEPPGVMLFRAVPEPAGLVSLMAGLGILCASNVCRRK
ncbi:PEP-CTERM sorting domain-containing protein [Lacipirellula sp.]|uniref:PEP-CTERM sorting domain-containing protein n=1 Tax=Lacipirellula sp. TaxID=2691419 RepID=UPI003D0C7604